MPIYVAIKGSGLAQVLLVRNPPLPINTSFPTTGLADRTAAICGTHPLVIVIIFSGAGKYFLTVLVLSLMDHSWQLLYILPFLPILWVTPGFSSYKANIVFNMSLEYECCWEVVSPHGGFYHFKLLVNSNKT